MIVLTLASLAGSLSAMLLAELPEGLALAAGASSAEDGAAAVGTGTETEPAEELVVTGRKLAAPKVTIDRETGVRTTTVTAAQIEARPGGASNSVANVLTLTPGATGSGRSLIVRGAREPEVRLDGVRLPSLLSDPSARLGSRIVENADLATGALPAMFGFVPAGVVTIETKRSNTSNGQVDLYAGTDGFSQPAIEWAGPVGGLRMFGTLSRERSASEVALRGGERAREVYRSIDGLVIGDAQLKEGLSASFAVGGGVGRTDYAGPNLAGLEDASEGFALAALRYTSDRLELLAAVTGAYSDLSSDRRRQRSERDTNSSLGVQLDATLHLDAHDVGIGATFERLAHVGINSRAGDAPAALYVQDGWDFADQWRLNYGLRLARTNSGEKLQVEPRVNLVWGGEENDTTVHAGYGRIGSSIVAEDLAGRDGQERDDLFDLGIAQALGAWTLSLDAYHRRVRNLLQLREPDIGLETRQFAIRNARLSGVELGVDYAKGPVQGWASLAWSQSSGEGYAGPLDSIGQRTALAYATRRPLPDDRPLTGSGGIAWRTGDWTLGLEAELSSGALRFAASGEGLERGPTIATLSSSVQRGVTIAGQRFRLRVEVLNIFDQRSASTEAAAPLGGFTRYVGPRSVLFGIEKAF